MPAKQFTLGFRLRPISANGNAQAVG